MKVLATFLVMFAATAFAGNDDMVPLNRVLNGMPEPSYQYARCAAFYLANVEWAGQALSEAVFETSKTSMSDLLIVATLVRSQKADEKIDHLAATVNLDARQIADFYLKNYRQSYALRGTAWEANALWESDAETCRKIAEVAHAYVNQTGQK